jgi:hypothetical protein
MSSPDETAHRQVSARFHARRAELAGALVGLLGPRAAPAPADAATAAAVAEELSASHRDAEPYDWALVRHAWPAAGAGDCADALHRLARNLGVRAVWLVDGAPAAPAQAAPLDSDAVLDNPFGFAALAEGDGPELRLLDRDVAAGLWLTRDVASGWELEVWGEPWLSATTRALRGVG